MNPMLIGLLAGLAKDQLVDKPKEHRDRLLAAKTELYSPWTGMHAQPVQEANTFGSALQGVTAGAMYGQAEDQNQLAKDELEMKKPFYNQFKKDLPSPTVGSSGQPSMLSPEAEEWMKKKPYFWATT